MGLNRILDGALGLALVKGRPIKGWYAASIGLLCGLKVGRGLHICPVEVYFKYMMVQIL